MKTVDLSLGYTHVGILIFGLSLIRRKEAAELQSMLNSALAKCSDLDTGLWVRATHAQLLIYKSAVVEYVRSPGSANESTLQAQQLFSTLGRACLTLESQKKGYRLTVRLAVKLLSEAGISYLAWDAEGDDGAGTVILTNEVQLEVDSEGTCHLVLEQHGALTHSAPITTPNALVHNVAKFLKRLEKENEAAAKSRPVRGAKAKT